MLSQPIRDEWVAVIAMVIVAVTFILGFAAYFWSRVRLAEMEATLKQDMIHRGMSAAEIESVLKMGRHGTAKDHGLFPTEPVTPASIAAKMAALSYDSRKIELLMATIRDYGPLSEADLRTIQKMVDQWADAEAIATVVRAMRPATGA